MSREIDYDIFWQWACDKFGEENCLQDGVEVRINSPFVLDHNPDKGHHCYCNPSKGVYHCWKTEASGTLIGLVKDQEGCDYPEASEILGGDRLLHKLEEKVAQFFMKKKIVEKKPVIESTKSLLSLPPDTYKISSLSPDNRLRVMSEKYLTNRRIPIEGLYICGGGKYVNRIVIPYYGPSGQLIYFNCRDITGHSKLRYQGPPKEIGVGKGDVVWMEHWPEVGSTIYLTEGEFDAMSLCQAGLNGAAAGGKNFSDKQLQLVKPYNVMLCFDLDKYGQEALNKVAGFMRTKQFVRGAKNNKIGYARPAKGYKDWNDMLIQLGSDILREYIKKSEKFIDRDELVRLKYGIH